MIPRSSVFCWCSYTKSNNKIHHSIRPSHMCTNNLVSATGASWSTTWLWVGSTFFGFGTFRHHDGKTDITTGWVLVSVFTWVDTRRIWTVTVPGLEWVEVQWTTWGAWVPLSIDDLLGFVIPKFVIEFTVLEVRMNTGSKTSTEWSWCESVGGCH